jgi:hypothetical protein
MKKTLVYIIALIFVGLSSCITDGNFLEYDESSTYDINAIRSDFDRTTQFVTDIYSYLPADFFTVGSAMRSSACDEGEYVWAASDIHAMTNGQWSPRKAIDDGWAHFYKGIRAANLYLEEFNNTTFDYLQYDEDYQEYITRYRNYEYEVRFLRAFFHFELLKRYASIPLEDKTLTEEEANRIVPASFDTAVQFIVDECDSIKEHLQPDYDNALFKNEISRIKKAAAYALKARVLLYAASPLHNPNEEKTRWELAAQASADILRAVDNGEAGFTLTRLPFYEMVLSGTNYEQQEVILAARTGKSGDLEAANFPIGVEGGNSGNCPTHNLVEKYGMQTGRTLDEKDPWKNRDPRLGWNVVLNGERFAYNQVTEIWEGGLSGLPKTGATKTGYYLKKFLINSTNLKPGQTSTFGHNFILFRYAEVYLNYAEAVNEAYGPNVAPPFYHMTAIDAANVVRSRRGLTIPTYAASDFDQKTFQTELQDERWRELAFEDHRFWDIRRWKIGAETQRDIKRLRIQSDPEDPRGRAYIYTVEEDKNARIWDDKMYLYPIPQEEKDKNPNLRQNPGWE